MTADALNRNAPVMLLDIEGTTAPIRFIYDVLFPYARSHTKRYLADNYSSVDVQADVEGLRQQHAEDLSKGLDPPALVDDPFKSRLDSLEAYIHWLMGRDSKATPLKSFQGKIWKEGYRKGELTSLVFDDVPRALSLWNQQSKQVCIYSSGSVLAQKLFFANTTAGDLTGFIHDYFDTDVGGKREEESYRCIASRLKREPSEVVFFSDITEELDAARAAGMHTVLCVRPGNHPQPEPAEHPVIHTFDEFFSAG
ncbi:MAG TPA: acireductone synthase [Blastocatellia bacterium]|nr:acireductone synthase [Blastocatellia bacterium]